MKLLMVILVSIFMVGGMSCESKTEKPTTRKEFKAPMFFSYATTLPITAEKRRQAVEAAKKELDSTKYELTGLIVVIESPEVLINVHYKER